MHVERGNAQREPSQEAVKEVESPGEASSGVHKPW